MERYWCLYRAWLIFKRCHKLKDEPAVICISLCPLCYNCFQKWSVELNIQDSDPFTGLLFGDVLPSTFTTMFQGLRLSTMNLFSTRHDVKEKRYIKCFLVDNEPQNLDPGSNRHCVAKLWQTPNVPLSRDTCQSSSHAQRDAFLPRRVKWILCPWADCRSVPCYMLNISHENNFKSILYQSLIFGWNVRMFLVTRAELRGPLYTFIQSNVIWERRFPPSLLSRWGRCVWRSVFCRAPYSVIHSHLRLNIRCSFNCHFTAQVVQWSKLWSIPASVLWRECWGRVSYPEDRSCSVVRWYYSRYSCIFIQTAAGWTDCGWQWLSSTEVQTSILLTHIVLVEKPKQNTDTSRDFIC